MCASGSRTSSSYCTCSTLPGSTASQWSMSAQVAAVVAPEVVQVVAEGLPLGEVLLEGAEAGIHRMPAHVDDEGMRQDGVDQADVAEVIGQLVGEVRAPGAQRRGLLEVAAAERGEQLRAVRRRTRLRIAVAPGEPCRRTARTMVRMFGSSMVPSTCEWLARICSTSVEPERGSPTMKIGAALGSPLPACAAKKLGVEEAADARAAALEVPRCRTARRGGAARCRARSGRRPPRTASRCSKALPSAKCSCASIGAARVVASAAAAAWRRSRRR